MFKMAIVVLVCAFIFSAFAPKLWAAAGWTTDVDQNGVLLLVVYDDDGFKCHEDHVLLEIIEPNGSRHIAANMDFAGGCGRNPVRLRLGDASNPPQFEVRVWQVR
jgi:hypothetical protein